MDSSSNRVRRRQNRRLRPRGFEEFDSEQEKGQVEEDPVTAQGGLLEQDQDAAQGSSEENQDAARGCSEEDHDAAQGSSKQDQDAAQGCSEEDQDAAQGSSNQGQDAAQEQDPISSEPSVDVLQALAKVNEKEESLEEKQGNKEKTAAIAEAANIDHLLAEARREEATAARAHAEAAAKVQLLENEAASARLKLAKFQ